MKTSGWSPNRVASTLNDVGGTAHQRDVDIVVVQLLDDFRSVGRDQCHRYAGMQRREGCDDAGREILAGRNDAETDCASGNALVSLDGFLERGHLVDNATRGLNRDLADLGRLRAGLGAQEKLAAKLLFQLLQLQRHGRRGQPERLRRGRNLAVPLDGEQRVHLSDGNIEHQADIRKTYMNCQ
jgi:hypothetical protein